MNWRDELRLIRNRIIQLGIRFPDEPHLWSAQPPSFPVHHRRPGPMQLPFAPDSYAYSPAVAYPVPSGHATCAHYRRGVRKYARLLSSGGMPEPIILLADGCGSVAVQDGSHRLAAAQDSGVASIPCRIAIPQALWRQWIRDPGALNSGRPTPGH